MKATDTAPGKRKQKAKMNLPNRLTVLRLIMVPVFIAVMVLPDSVVPALVTGIIGAFLFITAAVTDMLDGKIARKYGLITDFGKLMDPLADKLMVLSVLFTLLIRGIIPWEPVALLGGKELLMLIGGACLYNRKIVVHSLFVGKFAQVAVSMALILSFFHCRFEQLALPLHIILLWIGVGAAYTALVVYVRSVVRQLRGVENTYNERK